MPIESHPTAATDRHFVGYGRRLPRVHWPEGARVAVSIVVNYEAGAEYSIAAGDSRGESIGEFGVPINPTRRDVRICVRNRPSNTSRGQAPGGWLAFSTSTN